ncbi:MAG: hypothetical protein JO290_04550 [Sphingomonadaceae bacterium]|nr:hypothetical protein [Sphingomonadaceae bacterium]
MTTETMTAAPAGNGLTQARTLAIGAFSTAIWFGVAMFIRFAGPAGVFDGLRGVLLYALTIPVTIPLNARLLRMSGLPKRDIATPVALAAIVPPMLEGIVMRWFPAVYGGDPAVMLSGAIWILWAIGVGMALAVATAASVRGE